MDVFKRTKKNTDERIENIRNKIFKEMYYVVMTICLISIFFKMYKFGIGESALMEEAILELVILIVGGVYFLARSIFLGVFWDEVEIHDRTSKTPMSKKTIFRSVGLALLIAITMGINSAVSYADSTSQGFWYFIQVLFVSLMIYLPILLILFGGIYMLAKKISMTSRKS
ncbi:hypothetical protein C7437_10226 [Psychrobacillus insolitus]|uniref:Uncharacterized protein n=1 Tax=Psychrobacillus insolitus TaxID=1461 RepID=A0A2W7N2M5_9BACI|nr:DUF6773 family protein [Psychrobacillus insolitus]PZX05574.1 hypothetical protein C7437_10226 [Psychrobacillus insolitus]